MNRWLAILPLFALLGLAGVGALNLMREAKPTTALSTFRPAPDRTFETVIGPLPTYNFSTLAAGKPIAVNLFASWCAPCRIEHPLLLELEAAHPEQMFGVLYRDSEANGRAFLKQLGNPYSATVLDPEGKGGLDFGLTGVPETFVIGTDGAILLHVRGPLTPETVKEISDLLSK